MKMKLRDWVMPGHVEASTFDIHIASKTPDCGASVPLRDRQWGNWSSTQSRCLWMVSHNVTLLRSTRAETSCHHGQGYVAEWVEVLTRQVDVERCVSSIPTESSLNECRKLE